MSENEKALLGRIEELEADLLTALARINCLEAEVSDLSVAVSEINDESVYRSDFVSQEVRQ